LKIRAIEQIKEFGAQFKPRFFVYRQRNCLCTPRSNWKKLSLLAMLRPALPNG
jgi:hypothetical protein